MKNNYKSKTTYKIFNRKRKCFIDVRARRSIIIIENEECNKKKIAKEIFDESFYNEINEKIKILSEID